MSQIKDEYKVRVGEFEGPLDLLLSLIEKRKLCVNDISLAEVTDAYIEYIKQFEEFPISHGADFLIIASTLLLIKSISLLPGIKLTNEEKESVQELENRLKLYQEIKEKSLFIKNNFGKKIIFQVGKKNNFSEKFFLPTKEISVINLFNSARDILKRIPKKEKISEVKIKKVISLEEAMIVLSKRIQQGLKLKFSQFSKINKEGTPEEIKLEKINIVVNFLAMLELIKRGSIQVVQESMFSDIQIENSQATLPHYGA